MNLNQADKNDIIKEALTDNPLTLIRSMDRSDLYDLRDYINCNCNWTEWELTPDQAQEIMDIITKEMANKQLTELWKPIVKEFIELKGKK